MEAAAQAGALSGGEDASRRRRRAACWQRKVQAGHQHACRRAVRCPSERLGGGSIVAVAKQAGDRGNEWGAASQADDVHTQQ